MKVPGKNLASSLRVGGIMSAIPAMVTVAVVKRARTKPFTRPCGSHWKIEMGEEDHLGSCAKAEEN